MIKRILSMMGVGALLLATPVAGQASSAQVAEGRSALFNNGSPTASGILNANTAFMAAVQDNPSDREARCFAAVTRLMASALTKESGPALASIRDLLESVGFTRNGNDDLIVGPPYDLPIEVTDKFNNVKYHPPATIPSASEASDYLAGPLVSLIDASAADLDAIINNSSAENPFVVTLTAVETGDLPVEIDLADILSLKALLTTIKAQALMLHAWNMDNVDIRQLCILDNAGVLQLQRDLLDKYQNWMHLNPGATAIMDSAKTTLLLAITTSQTAYTSIVSETDDQTDDFLAFETQGAMDEAKAALDTITEVKNSIDENRPAMVLGEDWHWTDANGASHQVTIMKDINGAITGGTVDFGWAIIDPSASQITSDSFSVTGKTSGPCPGTGNLSGTVSGTSFTPLSFSGSDCNGPFNMNITGAYGWIDDNMPGAKFDFTVLFGKNGQAPLDVRAYLPTFRADGEVIKNSFADPVLGGLWPEMTKAEFDNDDKEIQVATMAIDGSASDWDGIASVMPDSDPGGTPPASIDIQTFSVARDADYLYWMIKTAAPIEQQVNFSVQLRRKACETANSHPLYVEVSRDESGTVSSILYKIDNSGNQVVLSTSSDDTAMGNVVEGRVPLTEMQRFTQIKISGYSSQPASSEYDDLDLDSETVLLPTTTVSGNIQYNPYVTGVDVGQTFVRAYNEPTPQTGAFLGSAVVNGVGDYAISGLPIGADIYLFAHGDTDSNGIKTLVDYYAAAVKTSTPFTPPPPQPAATTQDLLITQSTPPETTLYPAINKGWNLFSSPIGFDVTATVNNSQFISIWKWNNGTWEVYAPGEPDKGQAYAQSKQFGFLATINPGEGFWLNSTTPITGSLTGIPVFAPLTLASGWNLTGLKSEYPSTAASIIAEDSDIISLWKWHNGTWAVAMPGETTPGAYAASKNFAELTTINPGEGFWVNKK